MFLRLTFCTFLFYCSCNNNGEASIQKNQILNDSISKVDGGVIYFEGKFVRIEKINERDFHLFLKNEKDSVIKFFTMMAMSNNEIGLLKDSGSNIKINYGNFYNPITKEYEKVVKTIIPVYEVNRK